MKKLFAKPAAVMTELAKLKKAEYYRREDRAIVSNFFHGAPPLTQEEAEALGFTVNVNHLFGYTDIRDAADQLASLYIKPSNIVSVTLDAAPPGKRTDWGLIASQEASRVLKSIKSFRTAFKSVTGDASMHGEALFFRPNSTSPAPKHCPLSKMLIPDDATTDTGELSHFGIETKFSIKDLHFYYKRGTKGWNRENLGKILENLYKDKLEGRQLDPENLEELEYDRQQNSASPTHRTKAVDVAYFYQQRCDEEGNPFDLTISLSNHELTQFEFDVNHKPSEGMILFEGEKVCPRIDKILHPVFMDCIIGGAEKWHRVLGLGHLNYQTNHAVELLVNRAQQATVEGSMNLWMARDTTTREAAQQILLKHNGVLPEGLSLVPNRFEPNFNGILEMIQFFRQAGSKNARGVTPNNGDQNDMLEVQAIQEMNAGASASNNRTANVYDHLDEMLTESFDRLVNMYIDPMEPGYSEVMDFQNAMARHGIPLWWLQRANVQVKATRVVGDGVRHKELGIVQYLTTNRNQYAPEVQPKITRICTGLALDDHRLAEELTPITEAPDSPQQMRAESENAVMLTTRRPVNAKVDDVDELHVVNHFPALEVLIADALQFQNGAFIPQQAQAFQVVGAHIMMHIQRIEGRAQNSRQDPEREKARAFSEQLNQMAAMAEKLIKNMENAQAGQQEQMDPIEMARLQLEVEKLSLAREKLAHTVQKFERTQGNREQAMAFEQMLKLEKDHRENAKMLKDSARADVDTAIKVVTAGKKESNSAE